MRNKIGIGTLALLIASLGCQTPTGDAELANTVALMDATIPLAVAYSVQHDPSCVDEFVAAATCIDAAAGDPNMTPAILLNNLRPLGLNQEAELAVLGGVALWSAYLAQHPDALSADKRLLLMTISKDIRLGLPPATPDSLHGWPTSRRGRR